MRWWIKFSLAANIILLAALGWPVAQKPKAAGEPGRPYTLQEAREHKRHQKPQALPSLLHESSLRWDRTDLRRLLSTLRTAGAPPRVLLAVASSIVSAGYDERHAQVLGRTTLPRWQSRNFRVSPEQRVALDNLRIEMEAELREVLGEDYAKALASSSDIAASKYGDLPVDKIASVETLNAHKGGQVLRFQSAGHWRRY